MFFNLPSVTKALLIANGVIFLLQYLLQPVLGSALYDWFSLWPINPKDLDASSAGHEFLPWQLLTYGFLHGTLPHLLFNMLALLMFGAPIEYKWGQRAFFSYYVLCVMGAGLCQLIIATWSAYAGDGIVNTVGASGGVYGLILAYGLTLPHQKVSIFPLPVFLKARTVAIIFAVSSLLYGIAGTGDGIAHFAHLGGMLTGWLIIRLRRKDPPFRRGKKRAQLRIVR